MQETMDLSMSSEESANGQTECSTFDDQFHDWESDNQVQCNRPVFTATLREEITNLRSELLAAKWEVANLHGSLNFYVANHQSQKKAMAECFRDLRDRISSLEKKAADQVDQEVQTTDCVRRLPESFNGITMHFESWLESVDELATDQNWDPIETYEIAKQSLVDLAKEWVDKQCDITSWKSLKDVVHKRWHVVGGSQRAHEQLVARTKHPNESYLKYAYDMLQIGKNNSMPLMSTYRYIFKDIPNSKMNYASTLEEYETRLFSLDQQNRRSFVTPVEAFEVTDSENNKVEAEGQETQINDLTANCISRK